MKKIENLSSVSGGNEVVRAAVGLTVAAVTWLGIATYVIEKTSRKETLR